MRSHFALPEGINYLNTAYLGPRLRTVLAAGQQAQDRMARPWEIAWSDFFADVARVRLAFAQLIGASARDIALVPCVSYGIAIAAQNLQVQQNQEIVILHDQFPSNVYAWMELANRTGARLTEVRRPAEGTWSQAVEAAIGDATAIVALPHHHWLDGTTMDLAAIRAQCDRTGAHLVLDLSQSLGAVPFDIQDIKPDFAVAISYKWLLGPHGMGFMYVSPRHQQGAPLEFNAFSRANIETGGVTEHGDLEYTQDYVEGAARYDVGSRANLLLTPMALEALRQLAAWGQPQILAHCTSLIRRAAQWCEELGCHIPEEQQRAPHFIGIRAPQEIHATLPEVLRRSGVSITARSGRLRLSPYVHNTIEDIDAMFGIMANMLRKT